MPEPARDLTEFQTAVLECAIAHGFRPTDDQVIEAAKDLDPSYDEALSERVLCRMIRLLIPSAKSDNFSV